MSADVTNLESSFSLIGKTFLQAHGTYVLEVQVRSVNSGSSGRRPRMSPAAIASKFATLHARDTSFRPSTI